MRLTLYEDRTKLDEVVIVGYGSQKKANLSGAVSSVSIDALAERPVTNAENALAGLASGLTVTNSGGNTPGFETSTIRIRGGRYIEQCRSARGDRWRSRLCYQ